MIAVAHWCLFGFREMAAGVCNRRRLLATAGTVRPNCRASAASGLVPNKASSFPTQRLLFGCWPGGLAVQTESERIQQRTANGQVATLLRGPTRFPQTESPPQTKPCRCHRQVQQQAHDASLLLGRLKQIARAERQLAGRIFCQRVAIHAGSREGKQNCPMKFAIPPDGDERSLLSGLVSEL